MAMMVADRVFVDTNVLVHAAVAEATLHTEASQQLEAYNQAGVEIWISRQVLRELIATLTRPQLQFPPLPIHTVIGEAQYFESHFLVAEDSSQVTTELYKLLTAVTVGGKQVHDANIVATMQTYHITDLLTHNVADFMRFSGYINVIPLA